MPTSQGKPSDIPKQMVQEAYRRVAANKGAPRGGWAVPGGVRGKLAWIAQVNDRLYRPTC
jgi:hypothetical protein